MDVNRQYAQNHKNLSTIDFYLVWIDSLLIKSLRSRVKTLYFISVVFHFLDCDKIMTNWVHLGYFLISCERFKKRLKLKDLNGLWVFSMTYENCIFRICRPVHYHFATAPSYFHVKEHSYKLREEVKDPIPVKNFCGLSAMSWHKSVSNLLARRK